MAWATAIAGLLLGLVAACAPSAPSLTGPVVAGGVPLTAEHVLAPSDEFELRFPFYPDLNDRVTIGPDGRLSLQLINTVAVGGLTVAEATKLMNQRYGEVIRDPQATITLRAYAPQQIFVDGWVTNPGLVRSDVPLTVSRALAQAGGAKSGAHTDAHPGVAPHPRRQCPLLSGGARKLCRRRRRGPATLLLRRRLCAEKPVRVRFRTSLPITSKTYRFT